MSTGELINTIPKRFREERERLGFSRPELALALEVTQDTVKNWEGKTSSPNAVALAKFQSLGADVFYILTGSRTVPESIEQGKKGYELSPARRLAIKVGIMHLSDEDADLLLAVARRLAKPS